MVGTVLSCNDWVDFGFLLILGWVDFWVSVDFGIFFVLGCGVWWWCWVWWLGLL